MGQYYKAALIREDEIKVISPSGWKMMEHSWYGNADMKRVEKLLSEKKWKVIWIGDYSPCAAFVWGDAPLKPEKGWEDDYKSEDLLEMDANKVFYLLNHNKKEYINMTKQRTNNDLEDSYGWVVHPLPLLCRAETEEAGGDYHSDINKDLLGRWCGDEISIEIYDGDRDNELQFFEYEDHTEDFIFKE